MDDKTIALFLGITFGFAVVGLLIGFSLMTARTQTVVLPNSSSYNNEEHWGVVKDSDGRVKEITVKRHATSG